MRIWKKAVSMLLALVFLLTSAVGAGPLPFLAPASAAAAEVGTITIASDEMTVYLDEAFPSVVEYHLGENVFYGRGQSEADNRIVQIGVVTDYSHTSSKGGVAPTNTGMISNSAPTMTNCTPAVELKDQQADSVTYQLTFSEAQVDGVVLDVNYKVTGNVLEMTVEIVTDPLERVRYVEFPNNALISVRGAEDQVAYNSNYNNLDAFGTVADLALHNPTGKGEVQAYWDTSRTVNKLKVGHVMLNTDKLAATLEPSITAEYNYIETKGTGESKEVTVRPVDFMMRGPDASLNSTSGVKVVVTADENQDGKINWQDAAVAYREIMDPMTGENLAHDTIAVDIVLNYYGKQAWTWENVLDYIKRKSLATDNFPQIVLVKGAHRQYGDGHPGFGDANTLLGGNDAINWLAQEAEAYNTSVGLHMGLSEIYKESIHYEGMPIRQQGAWAFVDRFGAQVAFDRVWRDDETFTDIKGVEREEIKPEGYDSLYDYFYYLHKQAFPDMKFLYLDVSSGNPSGYESRWTGMKSIEKFREYDWAYFSEMPNNYVNYDPHNDASTSGVNTRYNNWNHTYYFKNDANEAQERSGSSNIRRFIVNDLTIYGSGTRDLQNILGPGYYKGYGFLGWHEFGNSDNDTVADSVNEFWENILPDTYLKNFQLMSLDMETNTAVFENGVKSVYDPETQARTITKDGVVYGVINNSQFKGTRNIGDYSATPSWINSELFMPWDPQTEEKIYAYSTSGNQTFELPNSWKEAGVTSVTLYELDQTQGRTKVGTYEVADGHVTLTGMEAGVGYVVYKEEVAAPQVVWGDRPDTYAGPDPDQTSAYQDEHGGQLSYQNPKLYDGNFNSGTVDNAWTVTSDTTGTVRVLNDKDEGNFIANYRLASNVPKYYDNFYLRMDGVAGVQQQITNLEPGEQYMAYVRVWNEGDYTSTTVKQPTVQRQAYATVDTGSSSVTAESQGYNTKISEHYGFHPMNNWGIIKVYFTAESDTATLTFGTREGTGAVMFDDVRVYKEDNPYGKDGHYYMQDFETSSLLGDFIWENDTMARLAWSNPSRFYPGEYIYPEQHVNGATAMMLGGAADTKVKTQPGMLKLEPNTGYDLTFKFKTNAGPADGMHYTIYSPSTGNILVNQYLAGESGVILTEKVSFRTDSATDYIIVFDNQTSRTAGFESDLFIDDFTLDLNPGAENPPLMPEPSFEAKSLIEAENASIAGDADKGAIPVEDADASNGQAVTRFQLLDEVTFGPMAAANRIRIRYKNATEDTLSLELWLKGEKAGTLEFPPTEGYENIYFSYTVGEMDRIVLKDATGEARELYLDLLSVSPIYEAESATKTGWAGDISDAGASGGKLCWINDQQKNNSGLTFSIQHSATNLVICHTNEKSTNRYLNIYVNGELWNEEPLVFEPTGAKYTYAEVSFPITLNSGDVLSLKAPEGESEVAMIDYIMLETDESKIASQVTLDRNELVFNGQDKEQLIATVLPETAIVKSVSWMSSNTNVATVSDSGLVRPTGKGTATITATLNGGTDTATCTVIVNELPAAGVYQNVALNKPATQNRNDNPETGNDGNTSANGPFSGGTPTAPAWWSVDLGGIYDISETKLYFKPGDRHDWFYKIEYSTAEAPAEDDPSWTILADYTQTAAPNIPGPHVETLEESVQARHLRVTLTGIPTGSNYWYTFAEFEAYGTPAMVEDNEADVKAAVDALTWDVIKGGNTDQESITADLALPTEGENGTAIAWSSDNTDVISDQGVVTRPAEEDMTVTLTATVTKGEASAVKTFTVTVLAETKPEPEQTPAPEFVQTTAQFSDETSNSVSFTLKNAAEAVYKVYAAAEGGEALTEPAVAVEGETLTLTFAAQPDGDTVYYISATETDKTESGRTAVTVKPYAAEVEEPESPVTAYNIKATAGEGGTISPRGSVWVSQGLSKTFAVTADEGYAIADVLVDGKSVGAVSSYTFEKVTGPHTIEAKFMPVDEGQEESFSDVDADAWYAEAVKYVTEQGLMNGTSETAFSPMLSMSRSMLVTVLYRLAGEPEAGECAFTDVADGTWYTDAVAWAAANGIVTGVNDTTFAPDAAITRESLAVILYRYAEMKEQTQGEKGDLTAFTDGASVSGWASEAMAWAVGEGILTGKSGNTLDPQGTATRAEVATILMRFNQSMEK